VIAGSSGVPSTKRTLQRKNRREAFISQKTVEHHVSAVFAKLGVTSRGEATARSLELRDEPSNLGASPDSDRGDGQSLSLTEAGFTGCEEQGATMPRYLLERSFPDGLADRSFSLSLVGGLDRRI
jgi:hypothetical protein